MHIMYVIYTYVYIYIYIYVLQAHDGPRVQGEVGSLLLLLELPRLLHSMISYTSSSSSSSSMITIIIIISSISISIRIIINIIIIIMTPSGGTTRLTLPV